MEIDALTLQRLKKFTREHREKTAVLPTLQDFSSKGYSKEMVSEAVRQGVLVELYVTLTTGAVVKGYKVKD